MPRNGDGSSDNGPFDDAGKPIAHGIDKVWTVTTLYE